MEAGMHIEVDWDYANEEDEAIDYCRVLYAYLHPETQEILYIGKADKSSVRDRLKGEHKEGIYSFLAQEYGLTTMSLQVGELIFPEGNRYSSESLADIESLLIAEIRPPANIQSINSRISRPGMVVTCVGEWQHPMSEFYDQ
jgi:thiamine kinase-like enzyme